MFKRILCFGDSNTWGQIPAIADRHPADVRWTGVLQRELGSTYVVVEEGYNGRTTVFDDPVENRLSGIAYFAPCLDSQSPLDLIILMLGTNDLKPRFQVDAYAIADGLRRYLSTLQTAPMAGTKPQILLASPILIDPAYQSNVQLRDMLGERADARSARFAQAYCAFAQEHGLHFINAADYAHASTADGIHMDADSHRSLGLAFANKVREILEK